MSIYDTHKPAAGDGGGLYLKIADGETVKLRFASEPAIFESEAERDDPENPGQKRTVLTTRYGWLVFNQETKQPQILQQSATFFKNLAALAQDEEWGDPQGYDIKITRKGTELETKYTIVPSTNRDPLDNEARDALKAVDLLEKLKASPFSQRVMWLSDYDRMAAEPGNSAHSQDVADLKAAGDAKKEADAPAAPSKPPAKPDVVIEDIGDEPINLDDIPF